MYPEPQHEESMKTLKEIMKTAHRKGVLVPAFNVPYLPMIKPIIDAAAASEAFILIEAARADWKNFSAGSPLEVFNEYQQHKNEAYTRLHLDHIPVIDELQEHVDYMDYIREAVDLGYDSVMIDGSRLSLDDNIAAVKEVADYARGNSSAAVEAELGAVLGHESGPLPPYEELFASGRGFTDVSEAVRFADESGCDWLSVAIGNIHGAITGAAMDKKKPTARINLEHLAAINSALNIPLVLHGGSGIDLEYVRKAAELGISKINIGTDIRQIYEKTIRETGSTEQAKQNLYDRCRVIFEDELRIAGRASEVTD